MDRPHFNGVTGCARIKVCRILSYRRGDRSANKTTTLGVDLAKNHFRSNGVDRAGKVVLRREVRRAQLPKTIAQLEPCVIGIGLRQCTFRPIDPLTSDTVALGSYLPMLVKRNRIARR
jgi:hypothetical protein